MQWLRTLIVDESSIAYNVLILALTVTLGLAIGHIKFRSIRLGVAGVLFSGLIFGHLGLGLDHTILEFVREFGLILFVYAVGLTVGPGFFNALRAQGLTLNLLAASVVLLGVATTIAGSYLLNIPGPVAAGIFSGASTNTPSLAASGQVLRDQLPSADKVRQSLDGAGLSKSAEGEDASALQSELQKLPGLGYAVTYPFGIIGIIITMLLAQSFFRIDLQHEVAQEKQFTKAQQKGLTKANLRVTNPNLAGRELSKLPAFVHLGVVVSRIQRGSDIFLASDNFLLKLGDVLVAVGEQQSVDELRVIVGEAVEGDVTELPSEFDNRWLTVTRTEVVGKTAEELRAEKRISVHVTRLRRAGVELPPLADVRISMGDELLVVGRDREIEAIAAEVGDDPKKLAEPDLIPVFVGIALGVFLGTRPFWLPGIPSAVRLGLAGGPLLVAIILSRFQRVGKLVWYLPTPANLLLKDMGICMFLAAVGIKSGDRFVETLIAGQGVVWMVLGAAVTLLPLLIVAWIGYRLCRVPYLKLVGVLSGSMTDPPALAFAISRANSESPAIAYATVYPLTMILRVICAQLMMIVWTAG